MKRRGGGNPAFRDRGRDISLLPQQNVDDPPPKFPVLENPPIPSDMSSDMDLVAYYKDLVSFARRSVYYLDHNKTVEVDIERYSDRYKPKLVSEKQLVDVLIDLANFPNELHGKFKSSKKIEITGKDLLATIDQVAAASNKSRTGGEDQDENAENNSENEYDEEMDEEENDYVDAYFDNGEGYESEGGDDEGAVY